MTSGQKGGYGGRQRRRCDRGYKSYPVSYGLDEPTHRAYARRLSPQGLFIATNTVVYAKDVTLVMELKIGDSRYRIRGIVRHSLKIESRMVRLMKPGMGVEFIDPPEYLQKAIVAGG